MSDAATEQRLARLEADHPRCKHGVEMTTEGCPLCLREARALAASRRG